MPRTTSTSACAPHRRQPGKTSLRRIPARRQATAPLTLQRFEDPDFGYDPRTRPASLRRRLPVPATARLVRPLHLLRSGRPRHHPLPIRRLCPHPANSRGLFSVDYDLNRLSDLARQARRRPQLHLMIFTADRDPRKPTLHIRVTLRRRRPYSPTANSSPSTTPADPPTRLLAQQLKSRDLATLKPDAPESLSIPQYGDPLLACITPVQARFRPHQTCRPPSLPPKTSKPSAWQAEAAAPSSSPLPRPSPARPPLSSSPTASAARSSPSSPPPERIRPMATLERRCPTSAPSTNSSFLATALRAHARQLSRTGPASRLSLQARHRNPAKPSPPRSPQGPRLRHRRLQQLRWATGGDYYVSSSSSTAPAPNASWSPKAGDVMGHGLPSAHPHGRRPRGILRSSGLLLLRTRGPSSPT